MFFKAKIKDIISRNSTVLKIAPLLVYMNIMQLWSTFWQRGFPLGKKKTQTHIKRSVPFFVTVSQNANRQVITYKQKQIMHCDTLSTTMHYAGAFHQKLKLLAAWQQNKWKKVWVILIFQTISCIRNNCW